MFRAMVISGFMALCVSAGSLAAPEWRSLGPDGATVNAFAFRPDDPATLFAATTSGVFVTHDGGDHWTLSGLAGREVSCLAVGPGRPGQILAGTAVTGPGTGGVYRSVDGGSTWEPGLAGLEDTQYPSSLGASRPISTLAVDGANPDVVLAGVNYGSYSSWGGLFRSTDGGQSWTLRTYFNNIRSLTSDPTQPAVIYLVANPGVKRSSNGGVDWAAANQGLSYTAPNGNVYTAGIGPIALAPSRPETLYAAGWTTTHSVFVTDDGAAHWYLALDLDAGYIAPRSIAVDPGDHRTAYLAVRSHGLLRTPDGGATWSQLPDLVCGEDFAGRPVPFPFKVVAVDPSRPSRIYLGLEGRGVLRSDDGGTTWSEANTGLTGASVSAIALDTADPSSMWAATGEGAARSRDGGRTWTAANTGIGEACGRYIGESGVPVPYCPNLEGIARVGGRLIATGECGTYESTDDGDTWSSAPFGVFGRPVRDPRPGGALFLLGTSVLRSDDGGGSWQACAIDFAEYEHAVELAFDPTSSTDLVVLTNWQRVLRSSDGCATWSDLAPVPRFSCPATPWFYGLSLAITGRGTLLAGTPCGLFASRDRGQSWLQEGEADLQVPALAADGRSPWSVYAGTIGHGVLESRDDGVTWSPSGSGLPPARIAALAFSPGGTRLYALTAGNGIYELLLPHAVRPRLSRPPLRPTRPERVR
ncbi:MAG: hypothetical protein HY825_16490 [Acidobacteria bacterium]|nr:hypothetical protein [Acidobacteriota bacterium]